MSTRYAPYRYFLVCNGCGVEHKPADDPELGFESAMEARASAYSQGWRFPHMSTKKGTPANRTSDVCPRCYPAWEPPRAMPEQGPAPANDLRRRPRGRTTDGDA